MPGHQVVVNPRNDTVKIVTDNGELTFQGKLEVAALSRDIGRALDVIFGHCTKGRNIRRDT